MRSILVIFTVSLVIVSCKKNATIDAWGSRPRTTSSSFYPLRIGNYWRNDSQTYTEVRDTLRIQQKLYYKVYSLVGGDSELTQYLRIDENQNLVEANPLDTNLFIYAKFNANVGDVFPVSNTGNNSLVKVAEKSDIKMSFTLDTYRNNIEIGESSQTYYKGIGPDGNYSTIKIDDKVYKYPAH